MFAVARACAVRRTTVAVIGFESFAVGAMVSNGEIGVAADASVVDGRRHCSFSAVHFCALPVLAHSGREKVVLSFSQRVKKKNG